MTWLEWLRWFLFLTCTECTIRYAIWWRQLRPDGCGKEFDLRPLMLGISLGMAGFAVFAVYALASTPSEPPNGSLRAEVLLTGDLAICVAAILCLVPCWRLSCGMPRWRLPVEIGIRCLLALLDAWVF